MDPKEQLIKKHPHLTVCEYGMSSFDVGMKNLRKELKEAGIKASVWKETYAGGQTVHVDVLEEAKVKDAEIMSSKYQSTFWDSYEENTTYQTTEWTETFGALGSRPSVQLAYGERKEKLEGTYKAPPKKELTEREILHKFQRGAMHGTESVVERFLPDIKKMKGSEVFLNAAWEDAVRAINKNPGAIKALVEGGQDPNKQTHYMGDHSLLQLTIERGYNNVANVLLHHGAETNPQSKGRLPPPLHLAKDPDLVQLLVEKGADINHKGRNNETAYEQAVRLKNDEVAQVLREAQAKELKQHIKEALMDRPSQTPHLSESAIPQQAGQVSLARSQTRGRAM